MSMLIHEWVVFHREADKEAEKEVGPRPPTQAVLESIFGEGKGAFLWKTCLREMVFTDSYHAHEIEHELSVLGFKKVTGLDAHHLCVEVICGLRSPIFGETEILGQFKKFVSETPYALGHKTLWQNIQTDAKKIRCEHLVGAGGQSYGSLSRRILREIPGLDHVTIVGAGQLAWEVASALVDEDVIHVFSRSPEKNTDLWAKLPEVRRDFLHNWDQFAQDKESLALIIAAPIETSVLQKWIDAHAGRIECVLDLRAESSSEPCVLEKGRLVVLDDVFSELKLNQERMMARKRSALKAIRDLGLERSKGLEHHPFGWDDLCA